MEALAGLVARLKMLNEELDPHFKTVQGLADAARKYVEETLRNPDALIIVATVNGEIAGMVRLEFLDRIFYEPRIKALVTDIYVKAVYRGRGVASLLLDKAREEARRRGAGILTATYPRGNVVADRFYDKMGFKVLQVERYIPL